MSKNRDKQRANKKREKSLNRINGYGKLDPTPYEAVREIIKKEKY